MCGRFTLTVDTEQLQEAFPWVDVSAGVQPRYNIAPTQPVAVVANNGNHKLEYFHWGLIPSWAKDPEIGNRMINARADTLAEKPSFKNAFRRRRCLVLANGFYEWQAIPGQKAKLPMYIRMKGGEPFAFAGLWEVWNSPDGSVIPSCTIITTEPNNMMREIHNRMPVILPEDAYPIWLDPEERKPEELSPLLQPYPEIAMTAYPVSRAVNSPANDTEACIAPLAEV